MIALSPSDVISTWRTQRAELANDADGLVIEVPRLEAAPYCDIVDLVLARHGPASWVWRDQRGNVRPRQSAVVAASRLAADAAALPALALSHYQRARRCLNAGHVRRAADLERGGLYLRMDHTFDLLSGGSVAHVAGIINSLRRLLPRLTTVSSDRLPLVEPRADFHELTPHYGVGRNLPAIPLVSYTNQVMRWWRRKGLARPGFIYARYSVGNYAAPLLRNRLSVPYVCEYNGSAIWIARNWGGKPMRFERLFQQIEDTNLRGADLIVAVSDASAAELIGRGYPEERILVNPNGVDEETFRPDLDPAPVRGRLGIGCDELVVGFIGTFGHWHGADILAEAFALLLKRRPALRAKLRLLLVGDGHTIPAVMDILKREEAVDRVLAPGLVPQSEAPAYLAACDILASPHVPNPDNSRFFGSPTKLFEYMAMGRAIVASRLEQLGQVLEHGRTALLVEPADAVALAEGLEALATNEVLRADLGRAARAEALKSYTWTEHTRRIIERLADLAPDAG